MADKEIIVADGGGGAGIGMMVGILLAVIVLVGALYFSGAFNRMLGRDTKIDVNIQTPAPKTP